MPVNAEILRYPKLGHPIRFIIFDSTKKQKYLINISFLKITKFVSCNHCCAFLYIYTVKAIPSQHLFVQSQQLETREQRVKYVQS